MAPFASDPADAALRYRSKSSNSSVLSRTTLLADGDGHYRKNSQDVLTAKHYLVILAYFIFLTCVALYVHGREPTALKLSDADSNPGVFIEERARSHLKLLTSFGPRPTGSYENEVLAVDYILRQVDFIKQRLAPSHTIEVEVQKPTGSFNLDFQDGFTSYYAKVKNILVKLEPKRGANYSVMVNCHYDSVPGSPGASDDAVSCAVMLEVLYLLSQTDKPFLHSIIFSFNGAEENMLQASHGFVTQHKWASKIKAFINLDSCGSGGRELLFQAGPENPWLIELYGRGTKYPFACILAQEIFQSGKIVPGDTDFRIFRDYGNIPGLDIAYIRNGYRYHTKYDREDYIPSGSIQRAGENLHGLLNELAMTTLIPDPGTQKHGNVIFFDFFGLFLVVYSEFLGTILLYACVAICGYRTYIGIMKPRRVGFRNAADYVGVLAKGFALIVFSWILSLIGLIIIAFVLEVFGATMSWHYNQFLAFGLFLTPAIFITLCVHSYFHRILYRGIENLWLAEQLSFESHQLLWCTINIVLYLLDLKTAMVLIIGILFPFVFRFIGDRLFFKNARNHARDFLIVNLVAWALPLELSIQASAVAIQILIPLMARSGAAIHPDVFIAVVFWSTAVLSYNLTVSFVHATRCLKWVLWSLGGVFLLSFFVAVCTPIGHPYSTDPLHPAPQRYLISHLHRTFHSRNGDIRQEDSGLWILPGDYNAAKDMFTYIPESKSGHKVDSDCGKELMCGMPFYYPALRLLRKSVYVPGPPPKLHVPTKLKLISQSATGVESRRLTFNATGPSHMAIFLSTEPGIKLKAWSLPNDGPYETLSWDDRPTYFIYYSHGEETGPWNVWLDLHVPMNHSKSSNILNIALIGHYLHGDDSMTKELKHCIDRLPEWCYSMAWPSTYDSWVF